MIILLSKNWPGESKILNNAMWHWIQVEYSLKHEGINQNVMKQGKN